MSAIFFILIHIVKTVKYDKIDAGRQGHQGLGMGWIVCINDGSMHHFHEIALSVYKNGSANANTISFIDFIPLWKWSGPDDKIRFTFDSASTDHFVDPISLADSACLADSA